MRIEFLIGARDGPVDQIDAVYTGLLPFGERIRDLLRRSDQPRVALGDEAAVITAAAVRGFGVEMNCASALRAAKARPAVDDPAWNSSGVRWGDGDGRCGPSTR